jgi:hypothetical protein
MEIEMERGIKIIPALARKVFNFSPLLITYFLTRFQHEMVTFA